MRGCAPSSTSSASTTSFCPRPSATRRAASTPRCSRCSSASTRSWRSCCRRCARSARRPIRRSCRSRRAPASCCRCRCWRTTPRRARSPTRTPTPRSTVTTLVTGGRSKLQWKPDWAMRWVALGVDYEMAGKDLIDSVKLSGEICRALGGTPPEGFNYELFLDEKGQKILQVQGQRPDHRRMAALRRRRNRCRCSCIASRRRRSGSISTSSPATSTSISSSSKPTSGRTSSSACPTRSGTSIPAIRPSPTCRSRSRCCSRWSRPRTPRTPRRCGASSAAIVRA